jgi:RNA polymerase sigma factor (sigma-70 family)
MRRLQRSPTPPQPVSSSPGRPDTGLSRSGASQLESVHAGDAQTFGDLYLRHAHAVYSLCGRRSGDWPAVEDLTSIVFLEAWRTRERAFVSADGSLLPWLLGIAGNVTAMSRRSLKRYDAATARFAGRYETDPTIQVGVEDEAIRASNQPYLQATINSALQALPRDQRVVAELCLLQGKTPREVSTVLGVPVSTVTSRLTNGRQRLRRLLRSSEIDEPSWLIGNSQVSAEPAPPTTRSRT